MSAKLMPLADKLRRDSSVERCGVCALLLDYTPGDIAEDFVMLLCVLDLIEEAAET